MTLIIITVFTMITVIVNIIIVVVVTNTFNMSVQLFDVRSSQSQQRDL